MQSKVATTPPFANTYRMLAQVAAEEVPVTGMYEMIASIGQSFLRHLEAKPPATTSRSHVYFC